jgi:Sensors of blue-light using FAD
MDSLHSIAYVSSAVNMFSEAELELLLQQVRRRNIELEITGLLLYSTGNFMQVLEGSKTGVQSVFASIARDPRHRRVVTIMDEPIESREFSEWAMAFRTVDAPTWLNLSRSWWNPPPGTRDPSQTLGQGRKILRTFWATCRM